MCYGHSGLTMLSLTVLPGPAGSPAARLIHEHCFPSPFRMGVWYLPSAWKRPVHYQDGKYSSLDDSLEIIQAVTGNPGAAAVIECYGNTCLTGVFGLGYKSFN